jgi:hypothetical protein
VQIRPTRLTVPELVDRLILFFPPKAAAAQTRLRFDVAHGTHSAIESQPERGTTVWFELPVMSAPKP